MEKKGHPQGAGMPYSRQLKKVGNVAFVDLRWCASHLDWAGIVGLA